MAGCASGRDAGATPRPLKLLRFPAVRERTGLSRSTIWRLERRGEFPRHHRIAPNVVAWVEDDVSAQILERTTVPAAQSSYNLPGPVPSDKWAIKQYTFAFYSPSGLDSLPVAVLLHLRPDRVA